MNFRNGSREEPEINLIPFIDILLVVLIFLMLISETALFVLRIREPDLPRPFKAWGYPYLPALLVLVDLLLLVAVLVADPMSGLYMAVLIALAVPFARWLRVRQDVPDALP